jgi:hypothetical protein
VTPGKKGEVPARLTAIIASRFGAADHKLLANFASWEFSGRTKTRVPNRKLKPPLVPKPIAHTFGDNGA